MRKIISRVLFPVLLLLLLPTASIATQGGYAPPSTDLPYPAPAPSMPSYWQETALVNNMVTRSGPGGNGIYTEELATFRLGIEIDANEVILVGWKEPSSPHPGTGVVNGVHWAMVEFRDANRNLYRAYVTIDGPTQKATKQRLAIHPDAVVFEDFDRVECEVYGSSTRMYYGPGTHYKTVTVRKNYRDTGEAILLPAGTNVQFICSESGYSLIEFRYPSWIDSPSEDSGPYMRAWVPSDAIRRR